MRLKNEKVIALGLWIVIAAISFWAHVNLPNALIATHFDMAGHANGFMSRDMALAFAPALIAIMAGLLLWLLPPALPRDGNIDRFEGVYGLVVLGSLGMIALAHVMIVLTAMHYPVDHVMIILTAVGLLFLIIGNFLPKTRRNWLMGVRTPWTLSDDRVWDSTHRLAGPLFILSGLTIIADAILAPVAWRLPVLLAAALLPSAVTWVYSYLTARKLGLT